MLVAQEMVGIRERHEALGMSCGNENPRCILDADGVIGRRMHDEQRLVQMRHMAHQLMLGNVVEECAGNREGPSCERHFGAAILPDLLDTIGKQTGDMVRI